MGEGYRNIKPAELPPLVQFGALAHGHGREMAQDAGLGTRAGGGDV